MESLILLCWDISDLNSVFLLLTSQLIQESHSLLVLPFFLGDTWFWRKFKTLWYSRSCGVQGVSTCPVHCNQWPPCWGLICPAWSWPPTPEVTVSRSCWHSWPCMASGIQSHTACVLQGLFLAICHTILCWLWENVEDSPRSLEVRGLSQVFAFLLCYSNLCCILDVGSLKQIASFPVVIL